MFNLYKGAWIDDNPPHLTKKIGEKECREILSNGGYLVRNNYNFDTNQKTAFWYIIKDAFGGMDELSSRTRNKIRRSLKTYDIKRVGTNDILEFGLKIYNSALEHYKVKAQTISKEQFDDMIEKNAKDNRFQYWGVFEKETNNPVALSICILYNDCCEYRTLKCIPSYLHNSTYPYYGLFYEMNRYYLQDLKLRYVSDGARSITEHSNIQPFLEEMFNFRKAYCNLQIEYKWWLGLAIKVLYPFRKIIKIKKIQSLLRMEAMRRNEY